MPQTSINGAQLFFREAGQGKTLLLIHGSGPDSRGWEPVVNDLSTDHRVIAYDRRGFGQSGEQPLVDWHGHAEDAAALLQTLGATPAVVVGWSGGGLVALDLVVNHPELVSALVLAETALRGKRRPTPSLARTFVQAQLQRALGRERAATETFLRWVMGEPGGGSTWDRDGYPEERREILLGNSRGIWNDIGSGDGSHIATERVRAIDCPVTLIRGDLSQPWFVKTTEGIRGLIPQAELRIIHGANHAFTFHKPADFAHAIRDAGATAT